MVFSALLTCRKSVSLLLVCLASFTASCPQSCRCNQNGQMIYVYCRNVNYLRTIPIASIPPVTNTLILWETQLANVPQNAFNGLSNLETIEIHKNPLASIDGNAFKGLSRLEDLHLDDNNLTIVDVDSLRGITNLTRFLATKNNLHTLPDGIFSDLVNLKMLKLGHNKLTSISANLLSGLRKLEFLSMPNNKISHVSETAFDSMASSLLTLDFDHNQLSEFLFDKMENFTSLVELYLKHNNFRTIPPTAKAIFDKIAERKGQIRISQNPLVCSKDLVWLQTWMRNNALIVSDEDKVTCLTPYRNLSKVRDFDFSTLDKWTIGELKSPPTVTPSAAPPATSSTASSTASTTTSTTTSSTASSSTSPTMSTRTSPTTSSTASQTTSSTASSTRSSTTSSALSSTTEETTLLTTLPSTTAEVTLVMSTTQSHPATDKVTTGASSLTGDAEKVTSATTLTQRTTTETDTSPTKSSTTSPPVTISSAKSTSSIGTEMTSSASSSTTTARDSQGTTTKGSTYKKISTTKPAALKKKDTSPTVLQITPGSNIDASTTKADKETAGSTDNFLNRNQQVILSASLVGLCIISFVAIMLYLFKRKVMSRQKKLSLRLPRMPYDRVDVV